MFRQIQRPIARAFRVETGAWTTSTRDNVSVAVGPEHFEVPAGHKNSDMRDTACNIGLNRRRDLTLRQDLRLHSPAGEHTLAELLKGKLSVLFGVPDMGNVCAKAHVPSYVDMAGELQDAGVDKIFCVAVAPIADAEAWGKRQKLAENQIEILADKNGGFSRLLGVDIEPPEVEGGPHSQRYAALIEDGILLKLRVESSLGEVKEASAKSILECLKHLQSLN